MPDLTDEERSINYRKEQILEMLARAGSGRTMMPKREADKRLLGIIYYNSALEWLDEIEGNLKFPSLKYKPVVKLSGTPLIDRVAKRKERERRYLLSHPESNPYKNDEDFIV